MDPSLSKGSHAPAALPAASLLALPKSTISKLKNTRKRGVGIYLLAAFSLWSLTLPTAPGLAAALPPRIPLASTALQYDGTNDCVTFGQAPALGAATFTLETWFKRTAAGIGTSTGTGGLNAIPLVTKGRAESENSNLDMNYFMGIDANTSQLVADFEEGAGGISPGLNHPITGTTVITNNVWYHAAATYDGTRWQLFLNGGLEKELTVSRPPRSDSIQHAALATAMNSTGVAAVFFAGVLDEARVWNYARTAQQIQSSMAQEIGTAPGLIGRWGMNEGLGTQVQDSSGSGVNGTATNGPLWVAGYPFPPTTTPTSTAAVTGTGTPTSTTSATPSPGSELDFDGVSDYVTFGSAPGLGVVTFTIETWFRREGAGAGTNTGTGGIPDAIPLVTKGRAESEASNVDMNYFLGIQASTNRLVADFEEGADGDVPG